MITKIVIEDGRLDTNVSNLFNISRSQAVKKIKSNEVLLNEKITVSPSTKTKVNDTISINEISNNNSINIEEPKSLIELDIVYQDNDIAVINKPRGLVVHPSPGHINDTLVNQLYANSNLKFNGHIENIRPGIVHRIDKDTSGLLVVAKNDNSFTILQNEVKNGEFSRDYLALVYGDVKDKFFCVDAPLTKPNHTIRKAQIDLINGREAVTHFEKISSRNGISFVKCKLDTGRTHQIRAHLEYLGYPIIGDPLYGKKGSLDFKFGQLLHAYKLSILHPKTLKRIEFFAPLDEYFKESIVKFYK